MLAILLAAIGTYYSKLTYKISRRERWSRQHTCAWDLLRFGVRAVRGNEADRRRDALGRGAVEAR